MQDQDYILFETYLYGDMPQEAVVDFEKRLKTDSNFNKAFKLYKETDAFLSSTFKNEEKQETFKANLQQISQTYFNTKPNSNHLKVRPYFKYFIAACAIVLLGFFVFNPFSSLPKYSDYAHYNTISLIVRGNNQALLQTAETTFNTKKFAKANNAFKRLLAIDKDNNELKFYYALCNIELDNFKQADSVLVQLQSGTSVFKHKASWYLALSKLKQDDIEACVVILQSIPKEAEDYKQAQKLLNKLD